MEEEKRNKIVAAVTINAIILIFIIVAVIIYQIVTISVLNKRKRELWAEYYRLEQKLADAEDILDRLKYDEEFREVIEALGKLGETVPEYSPEALLIVQ